MKFEKTIVVKGVVYIEVDEVIEAFKELREEFKKITNKEEKV